MTGSLFDLLVGAGATAGVTALSVPLLKRAGFVAPFNPIVPQDRAPAALGGGLALGVGFGVALAITGASLLPVLAALPALLIGLLDDIEAMRPRTKLLLQSVAAAAGYMIVLGPPDADWASWGALLMATGFAVVMMNAANFLDVSDGYLASISAVSFAGLAFFGLGGPAPLLLAGCCLGFLICNRPPASIYLGDAGSHFIGIMAAILVMAEPSAEAAIAGIACFGVALLELVVVTLIRWRRGLSIWRGSPHHSALVLQRSGFGKTQALLIASTAQLALIALLALARPA